MPQLARQKRYYAWFSDHSNAFYVTSTKKCPYVDAYLHSRLGCIPTHEPLTIADKMEPGIIVSSINSNRLRVVSVKAVV